MVLLTGLYVSEQPTWSIMRSCQLCVELLESSVASICARGDLTGECVPDQGALTRAADDSAAETRELRKELAALKEAQSM